MKKRNLIYISILVIVFAAIFAVSSLKSEEESTSAEPINLTQDIYYVDVESSNLKTEQHVIGGKSLLEMLTNAAIELKNAPKSETLVSAIPQNVQILDVSLKDNVVTVNVSKNYADMKTGEEMFCRAALVWTFTGFYFVDEVEILVEGVPLAKTNGTPFGPMGRDDLIVDAQIEAEPTNSTRVFTLYFANEDATALVAEERRVEVNPNQPVEKYILEQLILGPKEAGHVATVPPETKIRNIKTADKICYVDLSEEFVTKHGGGSTGETLTIYSIVNSLAELKDVEKVQFLIEGEKQDEFKGHLEFGKPFEPYNFSEEKQ
ncbi:MAG: GerMN domain-containing protein [Lachnospiraceae bacterium]|nr:GerMN domain-containing protein [Lachnospiraceae bacterium]